MTDLATQGTTERNNAERKRRPFLYLVIGVVLAGLLAVVLVTTGPRQASTEELPGISRATANLLSLDVFPAGSKVATDFKLTDQNGHPLALSQFRGKTVVLSFNDDQCVDVCTLLAQDVVRADQFLGVAGRNRVAFVSVNVNPFYPQVQYVRQWSDQHDVGKLSNWYFGTGSVADLQSIWKAYGVYVGLDQATRSVVHESVIDFVDPSGQLRAGADFGQNAVDVDPFSHGMAQAAVDLLPASERTSVAGPQATAGGGKGAQLSEQAPNFRLPQLGKASPEIGLTGFLGHPVVVNFWASSCVDCRAELAGFQQVAKQVPGIRFIGVDVADPSVPAALSLARQAGITYPLVADDSGHVASEYQVTDLPTTLFLDWGGKVVVRHPGELTAENLIYALGQFFPTDVPGGM